MAGLTQELNLLSKALSLRAERHQLLASNVANADTPNYKARDFDFAKAMEGAMSGRSGVHLARTSGAHLDGSSGTGLASMQYRSPSQSAVDGNTVDMDIERAQISENAIQYEVLTRLVSDRIQAMRTAISSNQG